MVNFDNIFLEGAMSVQLIKGEKILRSYDYATSRSKGLGATEGSKTLIITNKRIIHKESITGGKGIGLNISEMPVSKAKYVHTSLKCTRYPVFLVFGILLVLVAVAALLLGKKIDLPAFIAVIPVILAVACFVVYAVKRTYLFSCSIDTDTHITNAFSFSSVSSDSRTKGLWTKAGKANKNFYIQVKVTPGVVTDMANELGSVISAAANGDYDAINVPDEVAVAE
jgi:hypothetical protein